jgi:hypothetical protein
VSNFEQSRRDERPRLLFEGIERPVNKPAGPCPAESCQQNGDLPNAPLNNRQRLPSVGTIILKLWIFFGAKLMETFFIVLALAALAGVCIFLFVIEPRRKIYD